MAKGIPGALILALGGKAKAAKERPGAPVEDVPEEGNPMEDLEVAVGDYMAATKANDRVAAAQAFRAAVQLAMHDDEEGEE